MKEYLFVSDSLGLRANAWICTNSDIVVNLSKTIGIVNRYGGTSDQEGNLQKGDGLCDRVDKILELVDAVKFFDEIVIISINSLDLLITGLQWTSKNITDHLIAHYGDREQ